MSSTQSGSTSTQPVRVRRSEIHDRTEPIEFTAENLRAVGAHMREFWEELGENMLEREDALMQCELALIAQLHQLQLGHPGTAKSTLSRMILGRVVDKDGQPDMADTQLHVESRKGDVVGPTLPQTDPTSGRMRMVTDYVLGIIGKKHVLLDEIFDAPPAVLRGLLLTYLVERGLVGKKDAAELDRLKVAMGASNKTIDQLRDKYGDELDALFDRFAFIFWTTKEPIQPGTDAKIMSARSQRMLSKRAGVSASGLQVPALTNFEMDVVRQAVASVHADMHHAGWVIPLAAKFYRQFQHVIGDAVEGHELGELGPSKMASSRTMNTMLEILPAIAVQRHLHNPDTPLAVIHEDFKALKYWLMMRGPKVENLPSNLDLIRNEQDRAILKRLRVEDEIFERTYRSVVVPAERAYQQSVNFSASDVRQSLVRAKTLGNAAQPNIRDITSQVVPNVKHTIDMLSNVPAAEAKDLHAEAVVIYINLLAVVGASGNIDWAIDRYRSMQSHTQRLRESFHRSKVEAAEADFRKNIVGVYQKMPTVKTSGNRLARLLQVIGQVNAHEDVLGPDTVASITDLFRNAALETIVTATTVTVRDVRQACGEFQEMVKAQEILTEYGIEGKLPVEKLMEVHKRSLEKVKGMLLAGKKAMNSMTAQERGDVLLLVDQTLAQYAGLPEQGMKSVPAEQLPEDIIKAYIEFEEGERTEAQSDGEVRGRVIQANGDETVSVEWRTIRKVSRDFNRAELIEEYEQHCLEAVLNDVVQWPNIPAIARVQGQIQRMGAVSYGAEALSSPDLASILRDEFISAVQATYQSGQDGQFIWPFTPSKGLVPRNLDLPVGPIARDLGVAIKKMKKNPEQMQAFLAQKGIAETRGNATTFEEFLATAPAQGTGEETLSVEELTMEREEIKVDDILRHATQASQPDWAKLRGEIEDAKSGFEAAVAGKLVQEQLGRLSAGGATTTTEFIAKYKSFFGAATGLNGGTAYGQLSIDLTGSQEVMDAFNRDVDQALNTVVMKKSGSLTENLADIRDLSEFVNEIAAVDTSAAKEAVRLKAQAVIKGWVAVQKQAHTTANQAVQRELIQLQSINELPTKVEQLSQQVSGALRTIHAISIPELRAAASHYDMPDSEAETLVGELTSGTSVAFAQIVNGVVLRVQGLKFNLGTQGDFDMSNLNSINAQNVDQVTAQLRQDRVFSTAESALGIVKDQADQALTEGLIENAQMQAIDQHMQAIDQLKGRVTAALTTASHAKLAGQI